MEGGGRTGGEVAGSYQLYVCMYVCTVHTSIQTHEGQDDQRLPVSHSGQNVLGA